MLLPPCHAFYQFDVDTKNGVLNLLLYQRSCDTFLWVPFNIASYSTLLLLIAKITWLKPGIFTHTLWDAHIYKNHFEQVKLQLSREPLPLPELKILKDVKSLEDLEKLEWSDFELVNYQSHEKIVAPVAV
jgi:thymidylate synthase